MSVRGLVTEEPICTQASKAAAELCQTIWRAVKRRVLNGIDPEHPQNREPNGVIELAC
jgi:hypothetical protein